MHQMLGCELFNSIIFSFKHSIHIISLFRFESKAWCFNCICIKQIEISMEC